MTAFPPSVEGLRAALALAPRLAVPYVVVIGQEMPIQFETHRDCITNNLFATIQMVEVVPAMRMSADLSHYVVEREMPCPPTPALQLLIEHVLQRADSFQGRVAASCQV